MLRIVNNPPIIRVRLKYPDVLAFTYRYAHRLTSKGLFLVVKTPSLPGAQVRFELLLEGGDVVFAGLGEITWIKPFPDSKGFYGMIIRFITLDDGCQEILQLALSQKDASRKDAFDHQKIAEDPLPDDQIDTAPFISSKRNPDPPEPTTNRYYSLQANPALGEARVGFDSRDNLDGNWAPAEAQHQDFVNEDSKEPEDDFEEAPTEDTLDRRTKRAPALRPITNSVPDNAPTHRNPSLVLIEGIAAHQMRPMRTDDVSDITTGENLHLPKPQPTFNKIIFGDDDVPTDTSTKQFILPKAEVKPEDSLADEEDASLEFVSKRQEPRPEESPRTPSKPISSNWPSQGTPLLRPTESTKIPPKAGSSNSSPALKNIEENDQAPPHKEEPPWASVTAGPRMTKPAPQERSEELESTDLASRDLAPILPREENSSARNLGFATTDEISIIPTKPKESTDENLQAIVKEFKSKTETKKTRSITQNDPPTNIRILIAKPIPIIASEQDAEMERLAQEAGLADLEALVGWSRELIKNLPKTPAHIERELMALAIASKKLY